MDLSRIAPIFVGLLVLAAAGYLLFGQQSSEGAISGSGAPVSAAEQRFIMLTAEIEPVVLDTAILSDPRFTALVDIGVAIVPETSGRTDPFAPLPGITQTR